MKTCAYYQAPVDGNPIVAVFENPTWREYALERPVTGVAGANLCVIFRLLRLMHRNGKLNLSEIRENDLYKCRCAIVDVSRKAYSKSTNCSDDDFKKDVEAHIETLQTLIGEGKIVICFGGRARQALDILRKSENCSQKIQINVCQLSNTALTKFAVLDGLRRRLHLSEAMIGLVPLIVVTEYICARLQGEHMGEFREFYKGFRKHGNGDYPNGFHARLLSAMIGCESQCCKLCSNSCCENMQCQKTERCDDEG